MLAIWTSFGIGVVTGMRSMAACATLTWAATQGRTRGDRIQSSPAARGNASATALGEMVRHKTAVAPDGRILPFYMARLSIGAAGGFGGPAYAANDWSHARSGRRGYRHVSGPTGASPEAKSC